MITNKRRALFWVSGSAYSLFLFSLRVSGELVASGQHRVQRSWPAGPAAAWQGMTLITALFLSVDCQPALSALHHPCVALYTIIQLGIPSWPGFNNSINYCRCPPCVMTRKVAVYFFISGLCEGGHPDEGQQEESTAPPSVSGKHCFLFVVHKLIDTCG